MEAHIDSQEDTALLVDLLIEAGSAEVEATDIDGHTALHFCCLNGLTEAAKVLVCCCPEANVITVSKTSVCKWGVSNGAFCKALFPMF